MPVFGIPGALLEKWFHDTTSFYVFSLSKLNYFLDMLMISFCYFPGPVYLFPSSKILDMTDLNKNFPPLTVIMTSDCYVMVAKQNIRTELQLKSNKASSDNPWLQIRSGSVMPVKV